MLSNSCVYFSIIIYSRYSIGLLTLFFANNSRNVGSPLKFLHNVLHNIVLFSERTMFIDICTTDHTDEID